jgi:hypothetical protein
MSGGTRGALLKSARVAAVLPGAVALCAALLAPAPARAAHDDTELRAYVNDSCLIADEPFFEPVPTDAAGAESSARFLPLLGLVIGKVAELFINHEIQSSADKIKARAARKDTRYALTRQMNLYRADFEPAPTLRINAHLGCMTVVAATFKPEPADCTAQYVPKELAPEMRSRPKNEWQTMRTDDSVENQLRRGNVCVVGQAKAIYEARFEFSSDGTAYRLKDAGYRVESLLTTSDKKATRTTIYTLKISDPGATDQQEVLSSAWVNIGAVSAGARKEGGKSDAPWLKVPPLSGEARRTYDDKTRVHQEVNGEIEALKRAMVRNERILSGLDQRIAAASPDTLEGLKQERTRVAVQNQTQGAELDARNAEYQDLPRTPLEFMPVTIEVAVTETESEKKAQLALAEIIGKNGDFVGSTLGTAATGLLSKSVSAADVITEPDAAGASHDLETARARYFDAKVAADSSPSGIARTNAGRELASAKEKYNEARRSQGLEPIK